MDMWKCGNVKTKGRGSVEVWKCGSVEVWKCGKWKCGSVELTPKKTGKSHRKHKNRDKAPLGHSTHSPTCIQDSPRMRNPALFASASRTDP